MKTYKFELEISEEDLYGDEMWPDMLKEDPTGCKPLYDLLCDILQQSNIIYPDKSITDILTLKKYEDD